MLIVDNTNGTSTRMFHVISISSYGKEHDILYKVMNGQQRSAC